MVSLSPIVDDTCWYILQPPSLLMLRCGPSATGEGHSKQWHCLDTADHEYSVFGLAWAMHEEKGDPFLLALFVMPRPQHASFCLCKLHRSKGYAICSLHIEMDSLRPSNIPPNKYAQKIN